MTSPAARITLLDDMLAPDPEPAAVVVEAGPEPEPDDAPPEAPSVPEPAARGSRNPWW